MHSLYELIFDLQKIELPSSWRFRQRVSPSIVFDTLEVWHSGQINVTIKSCIYNCETSRIIMRVGTLIVDLMFLADSDEETNSFWFSLIQMGMKYARDNDMMINLDSHQNENCKPPFIT